MACDPAWHRPLGSGSREDCTARSSNALPRITSVELREVGAVVMSVVKIAIDPHKRINAVVVVDAAAVVLARSTFAQSTAGVSSS